MLENARYTDVEVMDEPEFYLAKGRTPSREEYGDSKTSTHTVCPASRLGIKRIKC